MKDTKVMRVKVPTKLQVRSEPSFDGSVVAHLDNKAVIEVSTKVDTPEGSWYKVETYIPPVEKSKRGYKLGFGTTDSPFHFKNAVWVYGKYLKRAIRFDRLYG